jgi:hypothetical protein
MLKEKVATEETVSVIDQVVKERFEYVCAQRDQ